MQCQYYCCRWPGSARIEGISSYDIDLICLVYSSFSTRRMNTLRLRQHGRHFPDIFKCIWFNENVWILIKISPKFVSKGPIDNIPASVQIMAWHQPGDKPLSEPIMVSLLMHICITRPRWMNTLELNKLVRDFTDKIFACNKKLLVDFWGPKW